MQAEAEARQRDWAGPGPFASGEWMRRGLGVPEGAIRVALVVGLLGWLVWSLFFSG
jgi:hypothetical protein